MCIFLEIFDLLWLKIKEFKCIFVGYFDMMILGCNVLFFNYFVYLLCDLYLFCVVFLYNVEVKLM